MSRLTRFFRLALARRWPAVSLRTYLIGLMLLATVPIAVLMSRLIFADVRAGERRLQEDLQRHAGAVALAVERELAFSIEALQALGQTDLLRRWAQHDATVPDAGWPRLRPGWSRLVLRDPAGRLLFDSAEDGSQTGQQPVDADGLQRALETRSAVVSPLGREPRSGAMALLIQQPVLIDGEPRYVLGAWVQTTHWQQLLQRAGAPTDGFSALYDAQGRLIAAIGNAGEALALARGAPASGLQRREQADGTPAYAAWQALALADWRVAVGQPLLALQEAQLHTLLASLATALGCLLLGVALALVVARRVTKPLHALAHGGARQPLQQVPVREVALLHRAMQRAELAQHRAHERLRRQADEFQALFESSPIGLALAQDPRCDAVLHNAEMQRLMGSTAEPDAVRVCHRGRPLERAERPLERAAASGEPVAPIELELQRAHVSGPRHVIAQAVPLRDAEGRPRGAIAAFTDITERKAVEAQMADADRRLRESLRLVELAQEAGHVGFFVYRFDSGRAAWTPGHARLFGLEPQALNGPLDDWLQRVHPDDRAPLDAALRRMIDRAQAQERMDFRVLAPDGAVRWLSSRMSTSHEAGQPPQVVGVTVDISDQKAVEEAHRALNEREQRARQAAEAASRAKDEFLAMFGHELRNPLSGIASAIEVLNQAPPGSPLAVSAREVIGRQTRHLTHLMDDLLDVGRVVSGKVLLTKRPFDLAELVRRLLDGLKVTGEADAHELRADLQPVWVRADATRIAQVATNLLTNALKYTPAGRAIDVVVRPDGPGGEQALLQVRDEGDGIAPDLLPKVFDLFVQGDRTLDRRGGGLGIGLTLVRRLIEQHGGRVAAESSPAGSVFSVWLAAIPAHAETQPAGRLPEPKRRRVLVIEDNADAANSLRALLELDGHHVELAADGPGGLEALLEQRPDAAVVDIGLPGMSGYDVARRSRGAGYAGMMVALTGYGQGSDIKRALQSGFDAHLAKPLDAERLRRLLVEGPSLG